ETPKRKRLIPSLLQVTHGRCFLPGGVPHNSVHPRSLLAGVFSHLFNGKCLATKRVGKEVLQCFHSAPPLFLCSLHDTRLEPSHGSMGCLPVNGMPVQFDAGERTSLRSCHLLFS